MFKQCMKSPCWIQSDLSIIEVASHSLRSYSTRRTQGGKDRKGLWYIEQGYNYSSPIYFFAFDSPGTIPLREI